MTRILIFQTAKIYNLLMLQIKLHCCLAIVAAGLLMAGPNSIAMEGFPASMIYLLIQENDLGWPVAGGELFLWNYQLHCRVSHIVGRFIILLDYL